MFILAADGHADAAADPGRRGAPRAHAPAACAANRSGSLGRSTACPASRRARQRAAKTA